MEEMTSNVLDLHSLFWETATSNVDDPWEISDELNSYLENH